MRNKIVQAWLIDHADNFCWICGTNSVVGGIVRVEVHHIERRSHAPKTHDNKCNYFCACDQCHATKLDTMPHAKQLAYKQKHDPEHYDLEEWLRLRDPDLKAPDRVTQEEIDKEMEQIG